MAGDAFGQPEIVQKTYEEVRVRLFRPAPEGFNPIDASDSELLLYGYPARPDAQRHPELHQGWRRVMSRSISRIEPQFAALPMVRGEPISPGTVPVPPIGTSANWAGSVAVPLNAGDPVASVAGWWTVPDVIATAASDDTLYLCATWIGIDGWQPGESVPPSELLQAGTSQAAVWPPGFGQLKGAAAWWEWVPDDPVGITNLGVSLGDVMYCAIRASETEASIYMANQTTGVFTSFGVAARPGTQLAGYSAEWILEVPIATWHGQPIELPEYAIVYFDGCVAHTRSATVLYAGQGELVSMVNASNDQVSIPSAATDTLIRVSWEGGVFE